MRRFVIKTLLTLLVLVVFACGLDFIITRNLQHSKTRMFRSYNDLYSERFHCDAVVMGSSRGQVQYDTYILDSILGVDSYNLGVDGRCIDAEIIIYNAYRKHNPKPNLIIQNVDVTSLNESNRYEREQYLPYLRKDDLFCQTKTSEGFSWADYYLPLVRYAGYTELIKEGLGLKSKLACFEMYKGYCGHDKAWDGDAFRSVSSVPFEVNPGVAEMFDQYLAQCAEEGIRVVMVFAPIYIGVTKKMDSVQFMFDCYQSYADRYGFPVLNYTFDSLSYDTANFYNATHLNRKGAELFTRKLAIDLKGLL